MRINFNLILFRDKRHTIFPMVTLLIHTTHDERNDGRLCCYFWTIERSKARSIHFSISIYAICRISFSFGLYTNAQIFDLLFEFSISRKKKNNIQNFASVSVFIVYARKKSRQFKFFFLLFWETRPSGLLW